MHLSYAQLAKRPTLLHRLVGLSVAEFEHLLEQFSVQYHQQVIQPRVSAPDRRRTLVVNNLKPGRLLRLLFTFGV